MYKEVGIVTRMYFSPAPDGVLKPRGGFPMVELSEAELVAGYGMRSPDGRTDRYFAPNGQKSKGAWPPDKVRQISILTLDAVSRANSGNVPPYFMIDTRRNIFITGMTAEELNGRVGKTIKIGSAEINITSPCEPCDRPDKLSGKTGFKRRYTNSADESIAGVRGEIILGGILRLGEPVYF